MCDWVQYVDTGYIILTIILTYCPAECLNVVIYTYNFNVLMIVTFGPNFEYIYSTLILPTLIYILQ